ncbi:MAG: CidA/LrgA family protein [Clostridia bacterium]
MVYVFQLGIILAISFIGEWIHSLIPLPIPASIYGLLLMLAALCSGALKVHQVRKTALFLIELMPLMFVPGAVGLMTSWPELQPMLAPFLIICAVSTVVIMAVTGSTAQAVLKRERKL